MSTETITSGVAETPPAQATKGFFSRIKDGLGGIGRGIRDGIRGGAEKTILWFRKGYDKFHLTIAEGNYQLKPKSLWTLLTGKGQEVDTSAATTMVGTAMLDTGRSFGKRMLWASAIAMVSIQGMIWLAGGVAVAGAMMFYLEYAQSKRAREETITEVNFAGQTVQGTRADLYHLHHAQEQIMNVGAAFKQASMESTTDTIDRIIDEVADCATRVKVLQGGRFGAGTDHYEFSEPAIKLVKDQIHAHNNAPIKVAAPDLSQLSVKPAFDSAAAADEIVQKIITLEQSLPAEVQQKLQAARQPQRPQALN